MGPADMLGKLAVFDPSTRSTTVATLTRSGLSCLIEKHSMRGSSNDRIDDLADLIFTDVAGRVARPPLCLGQRFGFRHGEVLRVNHDLTQAERSVRRVVAQSRP